ncbi:MAG: recombinase family protein [Oscillospiraceae bacterium]
MIYGYGRVSTTGQAKEGNGLEVQQRMLNENGAKKIYLDAYTGTKMHRPELDKLMSVLESGDTLIVTKLDRIARSAVDGAKLIEKLIEMGVSVNVLNMGAMNNTPTGKLIMNVFFAFAEFERDMIIQRTQEGKDEKRRTDPNYKDGRKKIIIDNFSKYLDRQRKGEITVNECCTELGISRGTFYNMARVS